MMDVSFERCEKSSSKVSGCPQHTQPSSGDELSILPGCVNNPSHASQQIWESPSQVFVADPCSDLPVGRFCQVMNVSRSGISAWRQQSLNPLAVCESRPRRILIWVEDSIADHLTKTVRRTGSNPDLCPWESKDVEHVRFLTERDPLGVAEYLLMRDQRFIRCQTDVRSALPSSIRSAKSQ